MFPKAGDSPAVLPDGVGAEMAEVCAGGREGVGLGDEGSEQQREQDLIGFPFSFSMAPKGVQSTL